MFYNLKLFYKFMKGFQLLENFVNKEKLDDIMR